MRATVLVLALAGCVGQVEPTPIVSVLERQPTGCFALLTPDNPVASELGVAGICPDPAAFPTMLAGVDLIEVVVDYGPEVDFADDTTAPAPVLRLLLDGEASDQPIELSGEQRVGARAYFVATFRAPSTPSNDVRIVAGVNAGFETEVATVFSIVPPPITFAISECPTGVCDLAAAVGTVHLHVAVPGDVALPVEIHQQIDGVAQPDPTAPVMTIPAQTDTEADLAIPVPATRDGALWVLDAQVNVGESAAVVATLHAPAIVTSLACGAPCVIAHGQSVGLEVDAPLGIVPATAIVTTRLDGVPQLVAAPLALELTTATTVFGLETLVAPNAGTWQIDVTVAGYPAPAIIQIVH